MAGLSVNDVVNVQVSLSPIAAATRNFGNLLLLGSSDIIDVSERLRLYTSLSSIAADFGTDAPEYDAATLFFSQSPTPLQLYVGRWASDATSGLLHAGLLTATQQLPASWTGIDDGSMSITIDGTVRTLTGLDFSAVTNMNGVAAIIDAALSAWATCIWNSVYGRLEIVTLSAGAASSNATGTITVAQVQVSDTLVIAGTTITFVASGASGNQVNIAYTQATGTITLGTNPQAMDTLVIGGTTITFVASGASGNEVNIAGTAALTKTALLAFLQASVDVNIAKAIYTTASSTSITMTAVPVGVLGNAVTTVTTGGRITVGAATLTGGGVNAASTTTALLAFLQTSVDTNIIKAVYTSASSISILMTDRKSVV